MWNSRVSLTVVAALAVLVGLCAVLGSLYAPSYTARRTARLTANADTQIAATVAATQAIGATQVAHRPTETAVAGATQTEVARPTITPTPTNTPTPTFTPTATPPAAEVACPASVTGSDPFLYPVPGGGRMADAIRLARNSSVSIVGRLKDQGWVHVEIAGGADGWMRSDALAPNVPGCEANVYDLSYLLGLADAASGREVVIDDTFVSNENGWVNAEGEALSPVLAFNGDAQLVVSTNTVEQLRPTARVKDAPTFDLATSFTRENFFSDSYVGVRFRDNGLTYYEVRILRNCQIAVYAVNNLVFTRPIDAGSNSCTDEQADWLMVSFTPDLRLTVQINDAEPVEVLLEDPSALYTGGGVELVIGRARATFSFIVVTARQ
jgi:hypothetical protein